MKARRLLLLRLSHEGWWLQRAGARRPRLPQRPGPLRKRERAKLQVPRRRQRKRIATVCYGSEFVSRELDLWAYLKGVTLGWGQVQEASLSTNRRPKPRGRSPARDLCSSTKRSAMQAYLWSSKAVSSQLPYPPTPRFRGLRANTAACSGACVGTTSRPPKWIKPQLTRL